MGSFPSSAAMTTGAGWFAVSPMASDGSEVKQEVRNKETAKF